MALFGFETKIDSQIDEKKKLDTIYIQKWDNERIVNNDYKLIFNCLHVEHPFAITIKLKKTVGFSICNTQQ